MINFHPDLIPSSVIKARAKELRKQETPAEKLLWGKLRRDHVKNIHFRRQVPMGRFILDFYAASLKLAIELDGNIHQHQKERDQERTKWLNSIRYFCY